MLWPTGDSLYGQSSLSIFFEAFKESMDSIPKTVAEGVKELEKEPENVTPPTPSER